MVAVTVPGAGGARGALRRRLTAWRVRRRRLVPAATAGASAALQGVLAAILAVRGLAGLALVAYGAWLAWPPAGFIVAGAGLLADHLADAPRDGSG